MKRVTILVLALIFSFPAFVPARGFTQSIVREYAKVQKQNEQYRRKEYQKYVMNYNKKKREKIEELKKEKQDYQQKFNKSRSDKKRQEYQQKINEIDQRVYDEQGNKDFQFYEQWRNERILKEKKERQEFRKKVGIWRWIGSKLFGKWVLYATSDIPSQVLNESELFVEDIAEMSDKDVVDLFNRVRPYLPLDQTKEPRIALMEFLWGDYERRNETWLQTIWRELGIAARESQQVTPISTDAGINIAQ